MKTRLFAKAASTLLLGAAALSAQAVPVAVFDNPAYVDATSPPSGSADALQAALSSLGNTVTTFTDTSAAGIASALQGESVLVIPEQQNGALAPDLSSDALDVIRNFVSNGGGLIISADYQEFLNTVFGYQVVYDISGAPALLGTGAAGTAFAGGPATLAPNELSLGFYLTALPIDATSIYTDAAGLSTVSLFQYGGGEIVHLGWDFNNAAPLGTEDGGWLSVLDNAVAEVSSNKVAEPGSLALMLAAFGACAAARRRRS